MTAISSIDLDGDWMDTGLGLAQARLRPGISDVLRISGARGIAAAGWRVWNTV
jgi:hypothetical protein